MDSTQIAELVTAGVALISALTAYFRAQAAHKRLDAQQLPEHTRTGL